MFKINRKGKLMLVVVAFLLVTPLTIFYILDGSGVFDTRSRADDLTTIPEEFAPADLNGDNKVSIADFSIWLSNYRQFKVNPTAYTSMSDLNDDGVITIADFSIWLNLWRGYKAYVSPEVLDPEEPDPEEPDPEDDPSIDENVVGYWGLDETSGSGAYLLDSSGNNIHGTPVGTLYEEGGKVGGARYFYPNDYINLGSPTMFGDLTEFTIEAWVKPATFTRQLRIFDRGSIEFKNSILLYQNSAGLGFIVNNGLQDAVGVGNVFNSASGWTHVAGVWAGAGKEMAIYINGVKETSAITTNRVTTPGAISTWIGCVPWTCSSAYAYHGLIDEVRFSNIARSADEIRESYERGMADSSNL